MSDNYVYQLTFLTDLNEDVKINIPRANGSIPTLTVMDYMDELVLTDAIMTSSGKPVGNVGATLIKTSIEDLNIN